jgi:glycosyltransferase involved in cell wall biosynthesis
MKNKTNVAILYRVIQEWRLPIFNRFAKEEKFNLTILHGPDFEGTKVVNSKKERLFNSVELFSIKLKGKSKNGLVAMPISVFLFFKLIILNQKIVISEGESNLFNAEMGFIYCKLFRKKFIWWSLGSLKNRQQTGIRKLLNIVINTIERNADAIISYSNIGKSYFESIGVEPSKIFVATNVIDTEAKLEEISKLDKQKIYKEAHVDKDFIILFVGALIAEKRVDMLLNAFKIVESSNIGKFELIIVGSGPERQNLMDMVLVQGIKNVAFKGQVFDGVSKYFLASDVFVLPGLGGLAVSEALVHGIPVIASIGDGCEKDLVANNINGIIDEELNAESLANYLLTIYKDKTLLNNMKSEALAVIIQKHNINTYMQQLFSAIEYTLND